MAATVSNAVILQKIEGLGESITRMEKKLDSFDCRVQEVEKAIVRNNVVVNTVEDHEERIRKLEKLEPAIKVVIWIAGLLGASVIGLIWSLITGSAQVIFK